MHRDIEPGALPGQAHSRAGRSVIAVIGINRYIEWPRLENAVSDATAASRLFRRLGFEEVTTPLLEEAATGEAMRRLVTDDLAQLSPDDSLVLFFAGHGHTHTAQFGDTSVKTGCLIPVDSVQPRGHVSATWLRLDTWLSDIARLPPRHILVIVDACHSGVALSALHKWRSEGPEPMMELAALQARRSRRIITSALDDQRAMDGGPFPGHSLFTGCLIEALSGRLAKGEQRVATGREIAQYLQQRVRSYPPSTQTPDFGTFELDDRGDIIVPILSEAAPAWEPTGSAPISLEDAQTMLPQLTGSAAPTRLGTGAGQVTTGSRRLWIAVALASALVAGIVLVHILDDDADRLGMTSNDAGGTGSRTQPAPAGSATRVTAGSPDAAASANAVPADALLAAPKPRGATAADPIDAAIPDAAPAARASTWPHESLKTLPSKSPSHDRGHPPAISGKPKPPGTLTAPPRSMDPAKPTTPNAARPAPQAPENSPPTVPTSAPSAHGAGKCTKADFAAVYNAAAPTPEAVRAALRQLNACREAGAITDADFNRYQTALVAKL